MSQSAAQLAVQLPQGDAFRFGKGRIVAVDDAGCVRVTVNRRGARHAVAHVLSTVQVSAERHVGHEVLLAVPADTRQAPIILGIVGETAASQAEMGPKKQIVIEAGESLTLKCGSGEIVIRHNGEVTIRGNKIVSRSAGPNKIRGATVSIN